MPPSDPNSVPALTDYSEPSVKIETDLSRICREERSNCTILQLAWSDDAASANIIVTESRPPTQVSRIVRWSPDKLRPVFESAYKPPVKVGSASHLEI